MHGAEKGLSEEEFDPVPPNTERTAISLVPTTNLYNWFSCSLCKSWIPTSNEKSYAGKCQKWINLAHFHSHRNITWEWGAKPSNTRNIPRHLTTLWRVVASSAEKPLDRPREHHANVDSTSITTCLLTSLIHILLLSVSDRVSDDLEF